jgi:hypothetical protein
MICSWSERSGQSVTCCATTAVPAGRPSYRRCGWKAVIQGNLASHYVVRNRHTPPCVPVPLSPRHRHIVSLGLSQSKPTGATVTRSHSRDLASSHTSSAVSRSGGRPLIGSMGGGRSETPHRPNNPTVQWAPFHGDPRRRRAIVDTPIQKSCRGHLTVCPLAEVRVSQSMFAWLNWPMGYWESLD